MYTTCIYYKVENNVTVHDLYDLSYDNSKLQLLYTVVEYSMIKEEFLYNVYK